MSVGAQNIDEPVHSATLPVVRYRCGGCSGTYRSLEGLLVLSLPMSGHPWKVVFDEPQCALKRDYTVAATIFRVARSLGEGLFLDPNGVALPPWRIAELRGDAPPAKAVVEASEPLRASQAELNEGYEMMLANRGQLAAALAELHEE